jgi:hypothetical protein
LLKGLYGRKNTSPPAKTGGFSAFAVRFLAKQAVESAFRVLGNDQTFFLRPALARFALAFQRFSHWIPTNRSLVVKLVPAPGIGPGRLCHQPRGCKPRTSASFVTQGPNRRASAPDVETGAFKTSDPSLLHSGRPRAALNPPSHHALRFRYVRSVGGGGGASLIRFMKFLPRQTALVLPLGLTSFLCVTSPALSKRRRTDDTDASGLL